MNTKTRNAPPECVTGIGCPTVIQVPIPSSFGGIGCPTVSEEGGKVLAKVVPATRPDANSLAVIGTLLTVPPDSVRKHIGPGEAAVLVPRDLLANLAL